MKHTSKPCCLSHSSLPQSSSCLHIMPTACFSARGMLLPALRGGSSLLSFTAGCSGTGKLACWMPSWTVSAGLSCAPGKSLIASAAAASVGCNVLSGATSAWSASGAALCPHSAQPTQADHLTQLGGLSCNVDSAVTPLQLRPADRSTCHPAHQFKLLAAEAAVPEEVFADVLAPRAPVVTARCHGQASQPSHSCRRFTCIAK